MADSKIVSQIWVFLFFGQIPLLLSQMISS